MEKQKTSKGADSYVVVGYKSWNKKVFDEVISGYPGTWHLIDRKEDLTREHLQRLQPRALFFLHWSWKVPQEIIDAYECINFHMTDLPYGRGGSPLQNLIIRGHKATKISAFRMTNVMDGGPIYLKEDLTLEGTADEIFLRANQTCAGMIKRIITEHPVPKEQTGEITEFVRRKPEESRIPEGLSDEKLYDFIRMLDGEGYPRAYVDAGDRRLEFFNAKLENGRVKACVHILPLPSS